MHWFSSRMLPVFIMIGISATGCSQQTSGDFNLAVDNFYGVEGFTWHYELTPIIVKVWYSDDFGNPTKTLWESSLSKHQRDEIASCLDTLPLDRLQDEYEDPSVDDGLQLTFRIRMHGQSERVIELRNRYQEDLFRVVDLINGLVPEDYSIQFDQGSVTIGSQ